MNNTSMAILYCGGHIIGVENCSEKIKSVSKGVANYTISTTSSFCSHLAWQTCKMIKLAQHHASLLFPS